MLPVAWGGEIWWLYGIEIGMQNMLSHILFLGNHVQIPCAGFRTADAFSGTKEIGELELGFMQGIGFKRQWP